MNEEIVKQFIDKTSMVFSTLFDQAITPGKAYILASSDVHRWDISGITGVTGSCYGLIAIRFTNPQVLNLYKMLKIDSPGSEKGWNLINDMTGEVMNIVAGNVLTEIGGKDFKISVPITIQGLNHLISWPKETEIVAIPFGFPLGVFELQINLLVNNKTIY